MSTLSPAELQVARRLATDAAAGELARALREKSIRWLLLKGPAVAMRLYEKNEFRNYGDVDVLVAPEDYFSVVEILRGLGYEREPHLPRGEVEHASTWKRSAHEVVDLHRYVPHLGGRPDEVWAEFVRDSEEITVARERIEVSGVSAFALLMALHALHHMPEGGKPLADLERAARQIPADKWKEVRDLAERLGAERNLAVALDLSPLTAGLRSSLGLPKIPRWEQRLRSGAVVRLATPIRLILETRGAGQKMKVVARELFPSRETQPFFKERYASSSMIGVLARRVVQVLVKMPVSVAVWCIEWRDRRAAAGRRSQGTSD